MTLSKQLELEHQMIDQGSDRYINSVNKKNEFDTTHVQVIIKEIINPLSDIIDGIFEELKSHKSTHIPVLIKYLNSLTPKDKKITSDHISLIVLRTLFRGIRSTPKKMVSLGAELGRNLNSNIQQKLSDSDSFKLGIHMIEIFCEVFPELMNYELKYYSPDSKYKEYILEPTDEYISFIQDKIEALAELTTVVYPMIYKPQDWNSDGLDGGYYSSDLKTNVIKGYPLSKKSHINAIIANSLNMAQSTPWRVSKYILNISEELEQHKPVSLKKIYPLDVEDDTERPYDIKYKDMTDEQQKIHQVWSHQNKRRIRARESKISIDLSRCNAIIQAKKFKNDLLYFPHDKDYRGRSYNKSMTGLNTQGSDIQKALIEFTPKPVNTDSGERWLCINLANLCGQDKLTMDERYTWTINNLDLFKDVVKDPIGCTLWHDWDKPMQGLREANEYLKFLNGEPITTHIQLDGTCNGVGHLTAITRDEKVAPHVGLLPTNKCPDVYQYVCDAVIRNIQGGGSLADQWISSELLTRNITKTPTMTRSYGAKLFGIKDGIKEFIDSAGMINHFDDFFIAGNYMGEVIWDAMNETLHGPMKFMEWVQTCAGILANANKPMIWTSPVGMLCEHKPYVTKSKRIEIKMNSSVIKYQLRTPTTKINKSKMQSSSSPNIIHSCDASHLDLMVNECDRRGINDFALVHDSFGFRPDVTELGLQCTKNTWIDMYSNNWMQIWYNNWNKMLGNIDLPCYTEFLELGKLDINAVKGSDFFFS